MTWPCGCELVSRLRTLARFGGSKGLLFFWGSCHYVPRVANHLGQLLRVFACKLEDVGELRHLLQQGGHLLLKGDGAIVEITASTQQINDVRSRGIRQAYEILSCG